MRDDLVVMSKPLLPVQEFVPEQTIQHYLDALLQDAADELARAEQESLAPAPQPEVAEPTPLRVLPVPPWCSALKSAASACRK